MQSKKIIAGTMSLLMAFGSVAGTVGTAFGTAVMASADAVAPSVDANADSATKLKAAISAAQDEIDAISKGLSTTKAETANDSTLQAVIAAVVNKANSVTNGIRFKGNDSYGNTVGTDATDASNQGTVAVTGTTADGKVLKATISFTFDNKTESVTVNITPSVQEQPKSANDLATIAKNYITNENNFSVKPGMTSADVKAALLEALKDYTDFSVEVTAFEQPTDTEIVFDFVVTYKNVPSTKQEKVSCKTSTSDMLDVITNKVKQKIEALNLASEEAAAAREAVDDAIESVKTEFDVEFTYHVDSFDYAKPSYDADGKLSGSVKVTYNNKDKVVDFNKTLPKLTKPAATILGEVLAAMEKELDEVKIYEYNPSTSPDDVATWATQFCKDRGVTFISFQEKISIHK